MALNLPYSDSDDVRKHQIKSLDRPVKGQKLLAHRDKTAQEKAHEQREMQAALKRDERKCRVPRCEFAPKKLPVDPCHLIHRGSGGNPSGDRTRRDLIFAACRVHHGMYDAAQIDVRPQTSKGTDGPMDFFKQTEGGRWELFASERTTWVSTERSVR